MQNNNVRADERAVSTTLSYSLNLAIAAILVSGLLFAAGGTVQDQRQVATREELRVIGEGVTAAIQQSDRMVQTGDVEEFRLDVLAPRNVAGLQYTINFSANQSALILKTENPDIVVEIPVKISTEIDSSEIRGGELIIVYTENEKLEVRVR